MLSNQLDLQATARTQARYQRIAPVYDFMEILAERRYLAWRTRFWSLVKGPEVLEVGIGTGKNMSFYPAGLKVTGIDLTPGMLERARKRAEELHAAVDLRRGDVQSLEFTDSSFDAAVATCVFCSVPNPVLGLRELLRVVRPGGQVLLMEHMRSANQLAGLIMDLLNPVVIRMMGANINRRTTENVQTAGLTIQRVETLGMGGIFKLIEARVEK